MHNIWRTPLIPGRYSRALRSSPTPEEAETLHNNRALADLRVDAFDAALDDASLVPNAQNKSEKALYRGALALYGLEKYQEALKMLQILVDKYPESFPGKSAFDRARLRVTEQKTGVYDFQAIYEATKLRPPRMDNATYKGPIEVQQSPSRGRGLFTTMPLKAGELLLCEKAFSYCFALPPDERKKASSKSVAPSSILMDVPDNRFSIGTHADLIRNISGKLASQSFAETSILRFDARELQRCNWCVGRWCTSG